jgi:exopolysaccharide biosynthesis WecB/TagA/CpsF family protein
MLFWNEDAGGAARSVTVNVASQVDLLREIDAAISSAAGFAVATLNLDHVVKLRHSSDFRNAYLRQTHVTADGNPIVWLMRLSGRRVNLVTGSDLIDPVAALAAKRGAGVAMIGSTETSIKKAASILADRHPGFTAVYTASPPMGFDPSGKEADALIDMIGRSGARVCFIALGAPKQEIFAARARDALPDVGFLSVGAGLDFVSGSQVRAPRVFRMFAAEWLWRLASDPRRLAGRYAACAASLPGLTANALKSRLTDVGAP